jgi:hypothetical protein
LRDAARCQSVMAEVRERGVTGCVWRRARRRSRPQRRRAGWPSQPISLHLQRRQPLPRATRVALYALTRRVTQRSQLGGPPTLQCSTTTPDNV